jgi:hypothetical protein
MPTRIASSKLLLDDAVISVTFATLILPPVQPIGKGAFNDRWIKPILDDCGIEHEPISSSEKLAGDTGHIIQDAAILVRVEKITEHAHHSRRSCLGLLILAAEEFGQAGCIKSLLLFSLTQCTQHQWRKSFEQLAGRAGI